MTKYLPPFTLAVFVGAIAFADGGQPVFAASPRSLIEALEASVNASLDELEARIDQLESNPLPETLPPGATLRGIWGTYTSQRRVTGDTEFRDPVRFEVITFPIPLATRPTVQWLQPGQSTQACPGHDPVTGIPMAAPGLLCIYQNEQNNDSKVLNSSASVSTDGVRLRLTALDFDDNDLDRGWPEATGTWAVTAPLEETVAQE